MSQSTKPVGNNDYHEGAKLDCAINDAKAIAGVFEKLAYVVIQKTDCRDTDISTLLQEFENSITGYDAIIWLT